MKEMTRALSIGGRPTTISNGDCVKLEDSFGKRGMVLLGTPQGDIIVYESGGWDNLAIIKDKISKIYHFGEVSKRPIFKEGADWDRWLTFNSRQFAGCPKEVDGATLEYSEDGIFVDEVFIPRDKLKKISQAYNFCKE